MSLYEPPLFDELPEPAVDNKFHNGNGDDGKHYWLTPPALNYVNPPFGSIIHDGKKKGMTAWVRKALLEQSKGRTVIMVYPIDKWVLMLTRAILGDDADIRNLGDVKWLATEDG